VPGPIGSCMNKTVKYLMVSVAVLALAGTVAACEDDSDQPADQPATQTTTYVPVPVPSASESILVVPSESTSVSPSPSKSVSVSPSVKVSVSDVPDANDGENPEDNRPDH
jgi:hypothetical protein